MLYVVILKRLLILWIGLITSLPGMNNWVCKFIYLNIKIHIQRRSDRGHKNLLDGLNLILKITYRIDNNSSAYVKWLV